MPRDQLKKVGAVRKQLGAIRDRWAERFARNSRFFLLALIIACAIEVVTDWNSMLFEIDALRGELRDRAQNYASIVAKASLEPVLAYDPDGLDALSLGLFDDEEVAFVRFADHQGTTVYDRLRPGMEEKVAKTYQASFREHYAHAMTRDVNGILQDPDLLATRMAHSRYVDYVQRWTAFIESAKSFFRKPAPIHVANRHGVVLYQDRLKSATGGRDDALTYVLSTIVDERGEAWGVTLIAFSLEKQNKVIREKLWKGTGMLVLLVGLVLARNVMGRREKIRQFDTKKRVTEAKDAILATLPKGSVASGELTATGALDQAEEVVDGLAWDARATGGKLELLVFDPAGEGHAVASTALHVLSEHRRRVDGETTGVPLMDVVAALGRAALLIPLGRPVAPIVARIDDKTGAFEAVESGLGALRIVHRDGTVTTPAQKNIEEVPEHIVGPLVHATGELPPGARLVLVAAGIAEDGTTIDVARVAEVVARWKAAEREATADIAADAAAWARGKSARLVDSDIAVIVVERSP